MKSTLERIDPNDENEKDFGSSIHLHLERYRFAGSHLKPGKIADIACGVGYGSHLLATEFNDWISKLIAIDNNVETITYARNRYAHPRIEFILADATQYTPTEKLDSIVSLETIEHLDQPVEFINKMATFLVPGGRFIASVPITPSVDANPFHLHDFTKKQFKKIFEMHGMKEVSSMVQVQAFNPVALRSKKNRLEEVRKDIVSFYIHHPSKFFLRIRSILKDGFNNKYLVVAFEKG